MFKQLKNLISKELPIEFKQLYKRKFKSTPKEAWLNLPRYTETEVPLLGKRILIPDNASFRFMVKEIFEEKIYQFKSRNDAPYIIDGGANIGLASIFFKQSFPNAEVLAFEPDKIILKYLKNNLKNFGFNDVKVIEKGLWNIDTTLSFKSEGADAGLISELNKNLKTTTSVDVVSLKRYLNKSVDFLKLDIEGAETVVLKDIKNELELVDRIFVEYHSFVGHNQSLDEIISILTKANFRLYISSPGVTSKNPFMHINTYNNMDMQLNIYGIKEIID